MMMAGTLLFVVSIGLVSAQRLAAAQEESTSTARGPILQFGCDVAKVGAMDPIFDPQHPHEHVFYGNKGVDAHSTYDSLVNNPDTSCSRTFATSSYWHPVIKDDTEVNAPKLLSVYYLAESDQTQIQHIPDGLQLLGNNGNGEVDYRCGLGNSAPVTSKPPYGCRADGYKIRVNFPECWDRSSLAPDSLVDKTDSACPSSHPYQIPTIRMSVHYENVGGVLEGPLMVSAGDGEWLGADFFHADVFDAPQQPDFNNFIAKCVMNVGDDEVPPSVCQPSRAPETTLDPSGPSGTVRSGSGTFSFSTTEADSTFRCRLYKFGATPGSFDACSGNGTHAVSGLESGTYTFEVQAVDVGKQMEPSPARRTWTVDTTAPAVESWAPKGTSVSPTANPTVIFSERMTRSTVVNRSDGVPTTFFIERGTTKIRATVDYVETSGGLCKAIMNPIDPLRPGVTYTATVTTAAKDKVGNALDQNPTTPLNQKKVWKFTVRS
jgi:hypothetical protein